MNPIQDGQTIGQANPISTPTPTPQPAANDGQKPQNTAQPQGDPQVQPQPNPVPQPDLQSSSSQQEPIQQQPQVQPMPQLNDQFLVDAGLGQLPLQERQGMIQQMRKTLEANVGMEIYKNLQEHQLQEFEGFMPLNDENGNVINSQESATLNAQKWMDTNIQGWRENQGIQNYLNAADRNMPQLTIDVKTQNFAAMNWLQRNFPRYREVVSIELNKLMLEVRNNVPRILEAILGPQDTQSQPQQNANLAPPALTQTEAPAQQTPVQPQQPPQQNAPTGQ